MSIYYKILERQIDGGLKTKEELKKNVALWQAYKLITDEEFMDLMAKIETKYPESKTEPTV